MLNCHNNLLVLVGARWFTRLSRLPLNSLLSARPSRVSGSVPRVPKTFINGRNVVL